MRPPLSVLLIPTMGCLVLAGCLGGCARYQPAPVSAVESAASLELRSLADPGLRAFVTRHAVPPPGPWPLKTWDLQSLTLAAFYFHPSLDVARAQWGVAQAGVKTAGGRPNPVVSLVPGYTINPAAGVSPWIPLASVDVPITTAGKRGHRIAQAESLAEAARLSIASAAWQVRSILRGALLDYAAARERADLLQQQVQLREQIVALLEQRVQAGAVARNELTLPRLALARTGAELADARRQAAEGRVRIASALGLPAQGIEGAEFDFAVASSADAAREPTTASARQQALLGRPDILAALADYAASESSLRLEVARQYPDVHLNPGYQFDQGEHKWSLGLSAELPLINQNQGPIAEARARRDEAAARFVALQARVIAGIDLAMAARASALEQVERQSRLTRLAREQSASVEALFQAGAADKLELTSAQLEASAGDLARLDAQAKASQAIAQLEDALQRPIEAWPSLEQGRPLQTQIVTP